MVPVGVPNLVGLNALLKKLVELLPWFPISIAVYGK
jgi:hypothetical protein